MDYAWLVNHLIVAHEGSRVQGGKNCLMRGKTVQWFASCWCGGTIDMHGDHLRHRGGLAAHILEIALGTENH
jgi:hypothetical protein